MGTDIGLTTNSQIQVKKESEQQIQRPLREEEPSLEQQQNMRQDKGATLEGVSLTSKQHIAPNAQDPQGRAR